MNSSQILDLSWLLRAQPYMATFFGGAIDLLRNSSMVTQGNNTEAPLVVCTLDLLAALCQINGEEFWGLALHTGSHDSASMLQLIQTCSVHPQVRQSACALLGEISKVILTLKLWSEQFASHWCLLIVFTEVRAASREQHRGVRSSFDSESRDAAASGLQQRKLGDRRIGYACRPGAAKTFHRTYHGPPHLACQRRERAFLVPGT